MHRQLTAVAQSLLCYLLWQAQLTELVLWSFIHTYLHHKGNDFASHIYHYFNISNTDWPSLRSSFTHSSKAKFLIYQTKDSNQHRTTTLLPESPIQKPDILNTPVTARCQWLKWKLQPNRPWIAELKHLASTSSRLKWVQMQKSTSSIEPQGQMHHT